MSATATADPGTTACPRCGAPVATGQDWCLRCGDAARTRLVPTPNWRWPVAIAALVATLAAIAIAVAFVELTRDPPPAAPTTAPAPTAPPATAAPPPTAAPPTAIATPPGATTPSTSAPAAPADPGATTTTP